LLKFIGPALSFLLHLGYFGPVLMGVLDSSFLFLPFGNDLLVVTLVARNHQEWWLYVLAAAFGSTIGVLALALVAHKLGEEGIRRMAGEKRFSRLHKMIETHGSKAVFLACVAPPPFPYTMVIAAAAALDLSRLRICAVNFFARGLRFAVLSLLAIKYGRHILVVANSNPFRWTMVAFIVLCLVGSALSIYTWIKNVRSGRKPAKAVSDHG
jgi:membrane protein YqaA with SNARE-associated domain